MKHLTLAAALFPLAACGLTEPNAGAADTPRGSITVIAKDDACEVGAATAGSGTLVFTVTNAGSKVTEFELFAADGKRVISELENLGPGLTRDLVLTASPGSYLTACIPGMVGEGIRNEFTVTDSGADVSIAGVDQATIDAATSQYADYVEDQAGRLVSRTEQFVAAYTAGDDARARDLYPRARTHWEGIETVAESFGDLDPKTDLREADLEPGQEWTGWHRIEKDLWPPVRGYTALTDEGRVTYAQDLLANVTELHSRVQDLTYTVDQIGNGSKGLLDEVATGKITGEEDVWSHTDLWDFQANVDGARVGYETLRPLLEIKDPALSATLQRRFDGVQAELDRYRAGAGFVSYDTVTQAQRKRLSDLVNGLSEPLSQVSGALTL